MKTLKLITWGVIAAAMLGENLPSFAAEKKLEDAVEVKGPDVAGAWKRRIPSIELLEKNLGDAIEMVHDLFPEINFIPPQNRTAITFNMVLRSVTLDEVLKAMELSSDGHLKVTREKDNMIVFQIDLSGQRVRRPSTVRVFNLSYYLQGRSPDDTDKAIKQLYEALEIALDMFQNENEGQEIKRPQLKMHAETKLLIAAGRAEELSVLDQVIKEVQGTVRVIDPTSALPNTPNPPNIPAPKTTIRKLPAGGVEPEKR